MFELLDKIWAIELNYANSMGPRILEMLSHGHSIDLLIKKKSAEDFMGRLIALANVEEGHPPVDASITAADISWDSNLRMPVAKTSQGNIALIPVVGPLTKYGDMCNAGMQDYQNMIAKANKSESIAGIVLMIDSPGGTVDGTPEFGLSIKSSSKPVGVFGDGLVASAAMWVASQADVIVGNKNNPTEFGSIGTLAMKQDYSKPMKKGYMQNVEIIRAPQSTDKALVNSFETMSNATRSELNQELSDITDSFITTVKAGRGEQLQSNTPGLFSGKTFGVQDAKRMGLIDSVGTLNTAISKVAEIAKQKASGLSSGNGQGTNQNANTNMNILEFLGLSKEAKAKLSAEDQAKLDGLESKFNSMESELSTVKAENGTLTAKVSGLESNVAAQATTITEKEAKIVELTAALDIKPAGVATTTVGAGDDKLKEANLQFETSIDAEARQAKEDAKKLELVN